MTHTREPLQSLPTNIEITPTTTPTKSSRRPDEPESSRKRVRVEREARESRGIQNTLDEFFYPSSRSTCPQEAKPVADVVCERIEDDRVPGPSESNVWRKARRRGVPRPTLRHAAPLQLASSVLQDPFAPPSLILMSSVYPPTGMARDFCPPMALAFNSVAKQCTASDKTARRLLAVAGEEGGVRIVDVDEPLGQHRDTKGYWWRAHNNCIFDIKWSADDRRIVSDDDLVWPDADEPAHWIWRCYEPDTHA
jgi:hypothetical protein